MPFKGGYPKFRHHRFDWDDKHRSIGVGGKDGIVTKDNSSFIAQRYTGVLGYNGPGVNATGAVRKLTRSRTGQSNPNWKQMVRDQQNATTPMSGTYDTLSYLVNAGKGTSGPSGGLAYAENRYLIPAGFGNPGYQVDSATGDISLAGGSNIPLWDPTIGTGTAYNKALVEYLKKVRQTQVSFSGPTFLGELGESIRMIRHPAQGLRNLMDAYLGKVKKAKKKSPKNWKKNLSSLWLEQAFGWTPLINDITNAFKTYEGLSNERTQVPITAYGIDEAANTHFTDGSGIGSLSPISVNLDYNQRSKEVAFVRFKGMVTRKVSSAESPRTWLEPFGFRADEFFPTAWELLPWSFLVDYFTNIGDLVSASVADTSRCAWTNVSVVRSLQIETTVYYVKSSQPLQAYRLTGYGDSLTVKAIRRLVQRTPNISINQPLDLTFSLPGSPFQAANMLALFTQCSNTISPQRPLRGIHFPYLGHR